jgi:hypothetical protein
MGVSLSTFAQGNPPAFEPFDFNTCRNPDVTLSRFHAPQANFVSLLTEQADLARKEPGDRQTAERLICTAETFSQAYRGVVRDGSMTVPTVPKRLIHKGRTVALNLLIKKQGTATDAEVNLAAHIMLSTIDLAKPYLERNGASFATAGIHFAGLLQKTNTSAVSPESRKKILVIATRSLLGDLEDDMNAEKYWRQIVALRSIVNSPGRNSDVRTLNNDLATIIQRSEEIRRSLRN